jgi:peptidoglycan/LPS O-acetylase OafA/YrhL
MTMVPDKHVEARMARIEAAVQRMQLVIVMVVGVVAVIWCLDLAVRINPDPDSLAWFYGGQAIAALIGMAIAFAAAKLIGYPLEVLKRA